MTTDGRISKGTKLQHREYNYRGQALGQARDGYVLVQWNGQFPTVCYENITDIKMV